MTSGDFRISNFHGFTSREITQFFLFLYISWILCRKAAKLLRGLVLHGIFDKHIQFTFQVFKFLNLARDVVNLY